MILIQLFVKFINFKKGDLENCLLNDFENFLQYNSLVMKNVENDMDIYFVVGNVNTPRQEKGIRKF